MNDERLKCIQGFLSRNFDLTGDEGFIRIYAEEGVVAAIKSYKELIQWMESKFGTEVFNYYLDKMTKILQCCELYKEVNHS